jgi:WD40-like Beta Propeller Repeat
VRRVAANLLVVAAAMEGACGPCKGFCEAAPCNLQKPFGTPTLVGDLPAGAQDPWLTPDERTIFFAVGAMADLYTATRGSPTAPFVGPIPVDGVNTAGNEYSPFITRNGLTLYYHGAGNHLMATSRGTLADPFSSPGAIVDLGSSQTDENSPYLLESESPNVLFFSATHSLTEQYDLYTSPATGEGAFSTTPSLVMELSSAGTETSPFLSPDGLTIFFASARTGSPYLDIMTASRPTTSAAFGPPAFVSELNSATNDFGLWLSDDLCRVYFSSDRSGSPAIYSASRPVD